MRAVDAPTWYIIRKVLIPANHIEMTLATANIIFKQIMFIRSLTDRYCIHFNEWIVSCVHNNHYSVLSLYKKREKKSYLLFSSSSSCTPYMNFHALQIALKLLFHFLLMVFMLLYTSEPL